MIQKHEKMPYLKIVAELPSVMAKVMFSKVWFLKKKGKNGVNYGKNV